MAQGDNSRRGNRNDNSNSKKAGLLAAAVAGVFATGVFTARPAHGDTFAWDTSKSGGWSNASNWILNAPTGTDTDQLVFAGIGNVAYTSTVDAFMNPWIINGMFLGSDSTATQTINNTNTAGFQLSGVNPFIEQQRSGAFNISSPIAFGGATTFSGTGTGLTTLSGVISGSNALTVTGGTWRLTNAANSWSGGTTITGGVLELFSNGADIPAGATGTTRLGTGGTITINAATLGGAAELRFTSGLGKTLAGAASKPIIFGANGGLVNVDGSMANANAFTITTSTVAGAAPAVFRFNGGPNHLSNNNAADGNWTNGNNALRLAITNSGPIRVELNQGAMFVAPNVASLANPLTIRGVLGGDPSSGPNGTVHTGITQNAGRFDLPSQGTYTYTGGLTLQDSLLVAQEGAARAIKGNITIAGTASGHAGNVGFFGRSTGTALGPTLNAPGVNTAGLNPLYIGYNPINPGSSDPNDSLTIQDGGIAALDLRVRSDQNNHNGVLLNAKTIINAGGKLVFRQSISAQTPGLTPAATNAPVGYHIVQGNIQGEGTTAKESVIDLYMPGDNTVGDGALTGGIDWQATSNLIINGSGIGGLRVNGLSRPGALFGAGGSDPDPNNQKVEAFLAPTRLAALTGSGGYLTAAPVGTTFNMAAGSEWAPGVTVGLRVVNSNATGDDVAMGGTFTHNILIENGATLNGNNQLLGPAVVTPGIGRIWGVGTISGNATIDAGGRLAPGTSIGTMAASGDLTINGTYEVEVTDPANDSLAVAGTLTLGASSVLDLPVSNTYGYSPYTIATYGILSGTFGTVNGMPVGPTGPLYGLDYTNGQIQLVFIAAQQKIWAGSDGAHPTFWDNNTTSNWNGGAAKYIDANHDNVTFDDSANSSNVVVTGGNVLPSSITVNSDVLNYTITSSAGNVIAGTTGLEKRGGAKLTLVGPNTFNGTVRVRRGTVSVGQLTDTGVAGPLGTGSLIVLGDTPSGGEGTLQYTGAADGSTNRSITVNNPGAVFDVTNNVTASFSGVVSGDGNVTKRGAGTAALTNAANTFNSGINVDQGTLRLGSFGAGTNSITLGTNTTAGTLDYTGSTFTDARTVNVNSAGGTFKVSNAATNLTFTGSVSADTIGKTGPGTLTLDGRVFLNGLNHTVAEGTLSLTNSGNSIAAGSSFTVPTGATLASRPAAISSATVKLTGGTLRVNTDASGLTGQFYNTVAGEITPDNTGANGGGSRVFNSPGNFNAHFNSVSPGAVVNTTATQAATAFVANNAGNGNPFLPWAVDIGSDYIVARWGGKISIPTTGSYNFWTSSDDGSVLFIDGLKVVDFNRLGGFVESPTGTVNLSAGVHEIMIAFYENAGGAGIEARWQPPGGVKDFLPNNVLLTTTAQSSASFTGNNVQVTASSSIDNPVANNSLMGNLTMSPVTLTHTGNGATRFAATSLTGAAGSAYTFNVAGGILDLGPVTAGGSIVLNKSGSGNLVLPSSTAGLAAGSSVNVNGGNLVLVQEVTGPAVLGSAAVNLNAGATGLQISSKGGDLTFNNPIIANDNVRIAAFATDGGAVGPLNVTLGSVTSGITVNGGKTITLSTDDDYNMNVVGAITGSSGINIASGSGAIDLQTSQSTGTLAVNAGTLRLSMPQTATVATTVGGFPNGNYATAQGNAVLTSPSLTLNNRGTWNANIPSGLPAAVAVNAGGILNANVVNSLLGSTVSVAGGNAQLWVDNAASNGSITLSNNGTITGRVQEVGADPANVRTLPTFAIAAGQAGNLAADRDGAALGVAGRVVAPVVNMGAGSTLNLIANNNTTLHAATINMGGGTARIVNNASDTRVTIGNVAGGTTAVTVTGSQATKVLGDVTAGNVIVSGAGLNLDPGDPLTSHVASPVQVNSVLNAKTGTTDMGNNVISGDSTRYSSGLTAQFYQLTSNPAAANYNTLGALNGFYTATTPVAPFVAKTTANGNNSLTFPFIDNVTGTPPGAPFAVLGFNGIDQFATVFRGQVFVTGSSQFFLRSDDGSVMFLAGGNNPFINNNGDHGAATVNATTTLGGWQDVVIGFYEAGGTAGMRLALGGDDDDHAVTNAMLRTVDPTGSFGGIVNVESNAQLIAGGISTLGTINFNGAAGAASMTLSSTSPQTGIVSNVNVNGTGVLSLGANNTVTAENLNVPDGTTFEKQGAGTLRVSVAHTFGNGATVGVSAGKLMLNGIGTGNGSVIVRSGGTLGGSGSMAGTASVQGGGHLAPGASVGTLTLGGLDLADGAGIDLEGGAAAFDKIRIASDGTSDVFTLTGVTSINLFDLGGVAAGDYVIIDYNNLNPIADALNHLTLSNPAAMPGFLAGLVNDTTNKDIVLHVEETGFPQWNVDGSGSWGLAGNWSGGIPDGGSAVANFLGKITTPRTVTLDGSRTVKNVNFDNSNKYTIAAGTGGTLTLGGGGGINVTATGSHEISAPVVLSGINSLAINGGLTMSGGVSISPGGAATKSGGGTLTISGVQNHAAGSSLAVNQGRVNLNSNAGAPGSAAGSNLSLSIGGGAASVVIGSNQDLKALTVSFADAGTQTLDLASPAGAGAFNAINVYASDLAAAKSALYGAIVNANKAGAANTLDGIIDSTKHAGAAIGIATLGDHVTIRSTRVGDLNLDGSVTISDFIDLASNFNAVGKTWQDGDLNYDGSVTISDFIDLASNFNSSYAGSIGAISAEDQLTLASFASSVGVDPAVIGSAVPEPGTLGLLAVGAMGLMSRRRRRM